MCAKWRVMAFVVLIASLALSACDAPPSPAPTVTPSPTPDPLAFLSALSPVASGQGAESAAVYNPEAAGPHRIAVLAQSGTAYEDWNGLLPAGWSPSAVGDTELVVLIGPQRDIALETQHYSSPMGSQTYVTAYQFQFDMELREARTGKTLATSTFTGSDPRPFPETVLSTVTRIDGTRLTPAALENWLCLNLKRQGCWKLVHTLEGQGAVRVAFSPDGHTLATGSGDDAVQLWDVDSWTLRQAFTLPVSTTAPSAMFDLVFSPDGGTLASGGLTADTAILWEVASGAKLQTFDIESQGTSMAFSPDGRTLATGSVDDTIKLWDVASGAQLKTILARTGKGSAQFTQVDLQSIAFSPDGRTLASSSNDDEIFLWDVATGIQRQTIAAPERGIYDVTFSPDGRTLASASGTVVLWDVASGTALHTFTRHGNDVQRVAFSPDGRILASGSLDCTVMLWAVASGGYLQTLSDDYVHRCAAPLPGETSAVSDLAFSPDGNTLAVGLYRGATLIWTLDDR